MKTDLTETLDILQKIKKMEKDMFDLKISILKNISLPIKKVVSLKGIIKEIEFTDEDFTEAKKSLYSKIV